VHGKQEVEKTYTPELGRDALAQLNVRVINFEIDNVIDAGKLLAAIDLREVHCFANVDLPVAQDLPFFVPAASHDEDAASNC
jgi:hypothetical protein